MSDEFWSVEGHDKDGRTVLYLPHLTNDEIGQLMPVALANPMVGGIVIFRPTVALNPEGREAQFGLAMAGLEVRQP